LRTPGRDAAKNIHRRYQRPDWPDLKRGLSDQYDIGGLDRNNDPPVEDVVTADISDYAQTLAALRARMPIECVVHLAANARLDAPWPLVLESNIIGTRNVYESARVLGVNKVVFASSLHVFLPSDGGWLRGPRPEMTIPPASLEGDPPDSFYAASKIFGEALARVYHRRYGMDFQCLRIGWVTNSAQAPAGAEWLGTSCAHSDLIKPCAQPSRQGRDSPWTVIGGVRSCQAEIKRVPLRLDRASQTVLLGGRATAPNRAGRDVGKEL
jgi:hypothetical protein